MICKLLYGENIAQIVLVEKIILGTRVSSLVMLLGTSPAELMRGGMLMEGVKIWCLGLEMVWVLLVKFLIYSKSPTPG